MSELELQTRTEHSRSLEDAEHFQAMQTLTELGLFIPVTEIETFHGRLGKPDADEIWTVDPTFANGSNDTGNNNVNDRPTLYTESPQVAQEFAIARLRDVVKLKYRGVFKERVKLYTPAERERWLARLNKKSQEQWAALPEDRRDVSSPRIRTIDELETGWEISKEAEELENLTPEDERNVIWNRFAKDYQTEVHEIVAADKDAVFIDERFKFNKLDEESKKKYNKALKTLLIPTTEGTPVSFSDKDKIAPFLHALNEREAGYIRLHEVATIAAKSGVDESVVLQLTGGINARYLAGTNPAYLAKQFTRFGADIITVTEQLTDGGPKEEMPINLEYVQRYMRVNHIVGAKQLLSSATLGKNITSHSFFDLEKTKTKEQLDTERAETWQKLGGLASQLSEVMRSEVLPKGQQLLQVLEDVHVKPKKLVDAAKEVDGYAEIFDADAGNWEGFTLAEHTETVLRNFDENFADEMPVEYLAPMRLAILAHDVGKPIATQRGEREKQKEYNAVQAADFLSKVGIDPKLQKLLVAVLDKGAELAFQIDVKKAGIETEVELENFAEKSLKDFNGTNIVTTAQIDGFIEMCKILQICDGGAYTSMAVTSRPGKGDHRNAPSFNGSFAQPVGFGKRGIRLKEEGEKPAAKDLTPKM